MAAHLRSALRSASHHHPTPSQAPIRQLSRFSPAKAQVQPVTQSPTVDIPPPLDEPSPSSPGTSSASSIARRAEPAKTSKAFFDATGVLWVGVGNDQPPDPNKANLGKSKASEEALPHYAKELDGLIFFVSI